MTSNRVQILLIATLLSSLLASCRTTGRRIMKGDVYDYLYTELEKQGAKLPDEYTIVEVYVEDWEVYSDDDRISIRIDNDALAFFMFFGSLFGDAQVRSRYTSTQNTASQEYEASRVGVHVFCVQTPRGALIEIYKNRAQKPPNKITDQKSDH